MKNNRHPACMNRNGIIAVERVPWDLVKPTHITVANPSNNLGDHIQSEAQRRLWGVSQFLSRDEPDTWPSDARVPLCGWFGAHPQPFTTKATAIIVGFHCQERSVKSLVDRKQWLVDMVKEQGYPAFCRDAATTTLLRSLGVEAEFGGCVTLTLQRSTPRHSDGVSYYVDAPKKEGGVSLSHTRRDLEGLTFIERLEQASAQLIRYEFSARVVTGRLHAWLPCLALGVATCLELPRKVYQSQRFSGYNIRAALASELFSDSRLASRDDQNQHP
jgi:hypothetical protein